MNGKRLLAAAALTVGVLSPSSGHAQFSLSSYTHSFSFQDALGGTTMTAAFDGTNYWTSSGGSPGGVRLARYDAAGNLTGSYSPGLDFRSVFTNASGDVFARQFANNTIYKMTAPGVFTSHVVLAGFLDAQSSVVLNGAGTEYIALSNGGLVSRWDLSGNALSSVTLAGWGSVASEAFYPQDRGIASVDNYWLTFVNGNLSAWDPTSGARLDQATLIAAGSSFDSNFSLSYANGMAFAVDVAGGTWRGYDLGIDSPVATPEPVTMTLLGTGLAGIAAARRRRKSAKE